MIEINGMAHVILSVSRWDECKPFYEGLLAFLGLTQVFAGEDMIYFVGGRTALGVGRCAPGHAGERFEQNSVGLHHLCFRARNRADVDAVHAEVLRLGGRVVHPPEEGHWAPGYYSLLFEDPCGTRLEINHVPGQGLLADGASFQAGDDYR
ncbi:MAG: VOC family protein [Gammaproteobacteria bacterium]|nr:VOC family protein [bacterium]MCB1749569.1 VOC family protein [Gammaproteobacteria bacterium]MCP5198738.1 VOC family protein [Gammaproteobacteria bacterium]